VSARRAVGSACSVGRLRGGGSCGRGVYEVYEGLKVLAVCPWVFGLGLFLGFNV